MSKIVNLECTCGKVKGTIKVIPKSFFHVHCLCCDCQKFATQLQNGPNILDKFGGSELFQTYPDAMRITQGHENISALQFQKKGLYRWHTKCCNMPIANTMSSAKIPFIGVSVKLMKFENEQDKTDTIGPVIMKAFGRHAIGDKPDDVHAKFPVSFMPKILGFMLKGFIKKKNEPSPFFNEQKPIVKVDTLY